MRIDAVIHRCIHNEVSQCYMRNDAVIAALQDFMAVVNAIVDDRKLSAMDCIWVCTVLHALLYLTVALSLTVPLTDHDFDR